MEERYMNRCLQLAQYGLGRVSPNPMVGAVIVRDGIIIGEGYHRQYGKPHAEVNAISAVQDQSLLKGSTLYVNLEPCSHYGKTPPCADLIIRSEIPHVVIGHPDPYPEVSGRGIRMLKDAGIDVVCDFMKADCEELNKRFLTYHEKKRPYIILKWAQSSDNFIDLVRKADSKQHAFRFSNNLTQMMVHKMRAEEDAIIVGTQTALLDNPSLITRYWTGKNPLRITIDKDLTIPGNCHILDGKAASLIFTGKKPDNPDTRYSVIDFINTGMIPQILTELYNRKIQSLIVEGGYLLLSSFIQSGLWDEATVEITPDELKNGIPAPSIRGKIQDVKNCKQSVVYSYRNLPIP